VPSPIAAVPPFLRLGDTDENSKRLSAYDFLFMLIANSGSVSFGFENIDDAVCVSASRAFGNF